MKEAETRTTPRAEFDRLADEYEAQHRLNIAITGEGPEYFSEHKVADLANLIQAQGISANRILDFGSGIGNSIPFFRKYFASSQLKCADVSARSIEISQVRFPGQESYVLVDAEIGVPTHSQDIVFSACVFHHIPQQEHHHWLAELRRVTRPGGLLAIYEHNPLNPLTLHAVKTCPLDINARLIRAATMRKRVVMGGWTDAHVEYKVFFPSALRSLRPLERYLGWLGLGAQYRLAALRP
jgi:ubiquinone/menaquinone biosynthesis C-methylase UbiE